MRKRSNIQIFCRWNSAYLIAAQFLLLLLIWLAVEPASRLLAQGTVPVALYDPLSPDEEQAALNAALAAGVTAEADSVNASSVLKHEVLLVERHQASKDERQSGQVRRRSDTYIYDYNSDTLRHFVIDLESQTVEVIEELREVQLPLTSNEVTHAYYLAFNHEPLRQRLNNSYRQVTGEDLTLAAQLDVKAFIFTADSMPDSVNEYSEQCGVHRCAQIQFYAKENMVLDVQPIVDLSRGIVVQDVMNVDEELYSTDDLDSDIGTESDDDVADADEVNLESQPDTAGNIDSFNNSDEIFLPFITRRFFKDDSLPTSLILDQVLFLWWCDWMSRTQYHDNVEGICLLQEGFE